MCCYHCIILTQNGPQAIVPSIQCIVLAAGEARRFGATKLLAEHDGKSLLDLALTTAQTACPGRVCLVVGCKSPDIVRKASTLVDLVVDNTGYRDGIGSSIACGVSACRSNADAVVIMLADQPTIAASHVRAVVDAWSGDDNEIVVSTHAGIQAPPTLFARGAFDQLAELTGDSGARSVIQSEQFVIRRVAFAEPAIDVDTEEDLLQLKR